MRHRRPLRINSSQVAERFITVEQYKRNRKTVVPSPDEIIHDCCQAAIAAFHVRAKPQPMRARFIGACLLRDLGKYVRGGALNVQEAR